MCLRRRKGKQIAVTFFWIKLKTKAIGVQILNNYIQTPCEQVCFITAVK